MRLLHVISSLKIGGAEAMLVDLVASLARLGYEQEVVAFHDGPNRHLIEALGIHVTIIKGYLFRYDPVFFKRLYEHIKRSNPTLLHCALWSANVAGRVIGKLLNIPVVCAVHLGVGTDGLLRNIIDRCSLGLTSHVVAVSPEVAQSVVVRRWVPACRVSIIENGIDVERVRRAAGQQPVTRAMFGLTDNDFVCGAVGRLIPRKNFALLVAIVGKLASICPSVKLVLVGAGPQEKELRDIIAREKAQARVHLVTSGQFAWGFYPIFNCFVQPSTAEGLSIALLEAMAMGLPSIVASTTGEHGVIENGVHGLIVPPHDIRILSSTICSLARDRRRAEAMGKNAMDLVKRRYAHERMALEYDTVFKSLSRAGGTF